MTESEETLAQPLRLGRGLRILRVQMVQESGEVDFYDFTNSPTTVLTGARNSSKTTTLRVINYCLGASKSVAKNLGTALDEKYVAFVTEIAVDGVAYTLTRESSPGNRGNVIVTDGPVLAADDVSNWLLALLGWPQLTIPLGIDASRATQETPLTFRSAMRHVYRREDSWTDFANKEQDFLRRAVVSLFLGFAPQRYETAEFELAKARRHLNASEVILRDVMESTAEYVNAVVRQLGLPPVFDAESLDSVRSELEARMRNAMSDRDVLTAAATEATRAGEEAPGLDAALPALLQQAASEAGAAAEEVASFEAIVREYQQTIVMISADMARLARLSDAVDVFQDLPVRDCPACEQPIRTNTVHDNDSCYLCTQPVTADVRQRRAEREQRALSAELTDVEGALERARLDLTSARHAENQATVSRSEYARRLHDERAAILAPFVAGLEDAATEIGRAEQQLAALPAIRVIFARRELAEQVVAEAHADVERLVSIAAGESSQGSSASESCATFADDMNAFLRGFDEGVWVDGQVTISSDDLTFYVGTRPWEDNLGAEARVLFFFAYSYALLRLDVSLPSESCAPGLLLLDNPYQQGLSTDVVVDAMNRLAQAASDVGAQLILTQARSASTMSAPHSEIQMPREYEPSAVLGEIED